MPETTRQKKVLDWAVENFGVIATNRDERAARLIEEAVEVAQAEGVPLEIVQRIVERIYSRPPGELSQEIGGLAITLDALAENAGLDVTVEAERELERITSKSKEWWTKKHAEKVEAGTANLTPPVAGACCCFHAPEQHRPGVDGFRPGCGVLGCNCTWDGKPIRLPCGCARSAMNQLVYVCNEHLADARKETLGD